MKKIKGRRVSYQRDGEMEYKLKNGLTASIMDLNNPIMKFIYKCAGMSTDKEYSVEILKKIGATRVIVKEAELLDYDEMVRYINEVEKEKGWK